MCSVISTPPIMEMIVCVMWVTLATGICASVAMPLVLNVQMMVRRAVFPVLISVMSCRVGFV